jgi:hypothetical protein
MKSSRKNNDEMLRRVAIQIVAQLPSNNGDAKKILELAERLLERVEEKRPWKRPASKLSVCDVAA